MVASIRWVGPVAGGARECLVAVLGCCLAYACAPNQQAPTHSVDWKGLNLRSEKGDLAATNVIGYEYRYFSRRDQGAYAPEHADLDQRMARQVARYRAEAGVVQGIAKQHVSNGEYGLAIHYFKLMYAIMEDCYSSVDAAWMPALCDYAECLHGMDLDKDAIVLVEKAAKVALITDWPDDDSRKRIATLQSMLKQK